MRRAHMLENLDPSVYAGSSLTDDDHAALQRFEPDACTHANSWYECCGDASVQASLPRCTDAARVRL